MTTLTLTLAAFTLAGAPASGESTPPPGGVTPQIFGCPGFPGNPPGGVCLYEPAPPIMEPRMGNFHAYVRVNTCCFYIPYGVGFIDVNSTATSSNICGVKFWEILSDGSFRLMLKVADLTDNGYGGYIVPPDLVWHLDYAEFVC